MTGPAPDGYSSWAGVPWSKIPTRFREQPDQWPAPQRPSDRRTFWWRLGSAAGVALTVAIVMLQLLDRSGGSVLPTGIRLVALWAAVPLALIFASSTWRQATQPYFKRSWDREELVRRNRPTGRAVIRALRRRQHIPSEMAPAARFWIDQSRAAKRAPAWIGLICSFEVAVAATQSWLNLAMWLTYVALLLGVVAWCGMQERSFRHWESRPDSEHEAG